MALTVSCFGFFDEKALIFAFKVGCEDIFANVGSNFVMCPEMASVKFVGRDRNRVDGRFEGVDKLAFARGFKNIACYKFRLKVFDAKFLAGFTTECRLLRNQCVRPQRCPISPVVYLSILVVFGEKEPLRD